MSSENSSRLPKIFISHATQDRGAADEICRALEAKGVSCWIAPRDVRPGRDYSTEIIHGIEASDAVVLLLSLAANGSKFVHAEVERAYSKSKPIYPVRLETVAPGRSLELFISSKQWVDVAGGTYDSAAERLLVQLAANDALSMELSPNLQRRISMQRGLRWFLAGAGIATIAALVAILLRPPPLEIHNENSASAFFMGSLVQKGAPITASYMLTDGWNNDGEVYGALDRVTAFEVYEIREQEAPILLTSAKAGQFAGQYQSTKSFEFQIDGLPKRVVSCLAYDVPAKGIEHVLQGFSFFPPENAFATFSANEAAAKTVIRNAPDAVCAELAAAYAKKKPWSVAGP